MNKEELKQNYENACNAYLRAFCEKHDFYFEDAFWVGGDVGGIADCSSYCFDMATIRTDIDEMANKKELFAWYDYCTNAAEFKLTIPNFHAWIYGCPRTSKEWFESMHKMRADFENLVKEERDRITKGDKDSKF